MEFNDIIIDAEDLKFFINLPESERLIFLYDLLLDDYSEDEFYFIDDVHSLSNPKKISPDIIGLLGSTDRVEELVNDQGFIMLLHDKFKQMSEINNTAIIVINNLVIINSDEYDGVGKAYTGLTIGGLVLSPVLDDPQSDYIFKHKKYCRIYGILSRSEGRISLN